MGWGLMVQYLILTIFLCIIIIFVLCLVLIKVMEKRARQRIETQTFRQKEELLEKARLDAQEIINKAKHAKEAIEREMREIEKMKEK